MNYQEIYSRLQRGEISEQEATRLINVLRSERTRAIDESYRKNLENANRMADPRTRQTLILQIEDARRRGLEQLDNEYNAAYSDFVRKSSESRLDARGIIRRKMEREGLVAPREKFLEYNDWLRMNPQASGQQAVDWLSSNIYDAAKQQASEEKNRMDREQAWNQMASRILSETRGVGLGKQGGMYWSQYRNWLQQNPTATGQQATNWLNENVYSPALQKTGQPKIMPAWN